MKKLTKNEFVEKSNKTHGNRYDYSKVDYLTSKIKVEIICSIHGAFWQLPKNHIFNKQNCPKCGTSDSHLTQTISQSQFLNNATAVHGNIYNYSNTLYKNNHTKIEIICPLHSSFFKTPDKHINSKQGCPKCGDIKRHISNTKSNKEFVDSAIQIHGDRYDYSISKYKNSREKVKIICKSHGEFIQWPMDHLNNIGCPKCGMFISKASTTIKEYLNKNNVLFELEKTFHTCRNPKTNYLLRFDFYIPLKNILIEYDGEQHSKIGARIGGKHIISPTELMSIQFRDNVKSQWAKSNNIRLVRINYKDNIIKTLASELL